MNYQKFLETVKTQLALRIDADVTLDIRSFTKNNGIHYDGLIILHPDLNVSPTIYLMPYYHRYLEGVCIEDICEDILCSYKELLPEKDFDTSLFTDYSKSYSRIVMRLVSYKRNEELLREVPYFRYQDLAILFYCMILADSQNQASILIHNEHLHMWKITKDDLYHAARQNTPKLLPSQMTPLNTILRESGNIPANESEDYTIPIYVLSNQYRTNGAAVLLYDGLLSKTADLFQKDLVILPSSIHEILIIPVDSIDETDLNRYNLMIQDVNETQLSDDEILSDHAYYYSRATQLVTA